MLSIRIAGLVLALASSGAAFAEGEHAHEGHGLEQVLIESATTPAQHEVLARHFRAKAAAARAEAKEHRSMAESYGGTKLVVAEAQRKHCNDLAANLEAQAKLYDELAAGHAAEATKK
jgi:hypothetical protein